MRIKNAYWFIIFIITITTCNSQTKSNLKSDFLIGKSFYGKIGQSCVMLVDGGGCDIIKYNVLSFKKDSISIINRDIYHCTSSDAESDKILSKIDKAGNVTTQKLDALGNVIK
jgi:hypothetical protein